MGKRDEILSLFPDGLKGRMKPVLEDVEHLNEIRLGVNRPCRIIREGCEYFLSQDGTCLTQGNNEQCMADFRPGNRKHCESDVQLFALCI